MAYKVLVIDDQRIFNNFPDKDKVGDYTLIHETTSQDGMQTLVSQQPWNQVWLDHDMGMLSRGSGTDMVNYIENLALIAEHPVVDKFYVHTMNPVGGRYMKEVLGSLGYDVETIDPTPFLDFDAMYKEDRNPFLAGPRR